MLYSINLTVFQSYSSKTVAVDLQNLFHHTVCACYKFCPSDFVVMRYSIDSILSHHLSDQDNDEICNDLQC